MTDASERGSEVVFVGEDWNGEAPGAGLWNLWNFGERRRPELASGLSSVFSEVPVGDLLNQAAARIRDAMIDLDRHLAVDSASLSWISSDMAEVNPYQSDFYLDLCRGITLTEAARAGGKHLVVTNEAAVARALCEVCNLAGVKVSLLGIDRVGRWSLRQNLRALALPLLQWLKMRRALARNRLSLGKFLQVDSIIVSWAGSNTLPAGAKFTNDAFLGKLPAWLADAGREVGFVGNPIVWSQSPNAIAANVKATAGPAALTASFLGLPAQITAYLARARLRLAIKKSFVLEGINLTPIVRLALARELASPRIIQSALFGSLAKGLKRLGLNPQWLFYTYENQPWEKAMLAGFRRDLPRTRLVGVQHAPIAESFLSGHLSERQWRDGTAPDMLITIGEEFRDRLLKMNAPAERIKVGGALRFPEMQKHFDSREHAKHDEVRAARDKWSVLVSCPLNLRQAVELTYQAALATADMPGIRLTVNFHPLATAEFRQQVADSVAADGSFSNITYVTEPASEWLKQADILLYNSSTTCFEAAARGVPVIYVGPTAGLDLDNMPSGGALRCREPGELRRLIDKLLSDEDFRARHLRHARAHVRRCFSEARPEIWREIIHTL